MTRKRVSGGPPEVRLDPMTVSLRPGGPPTPTPRSEHIVAMAIRRGEWFTSRDLAEGEGLRQNSRPERAVRASIRKACEEGRLEVRPIPGRVRAKEFRGVSR